MTQELFDDLRAGLAEATRKIDRLNRQAHQELGYEATRAGCARTLRALEQLFESFSSDWERDELELDEDLR